MAKKAPAGKEKDASAKDHVASFLDDNERERLTRLLVCRCKDLRRGVDRRALDVFLVSLIPIFKEEWRDDMLCRLSSTKVDRVVVRDPSEIERAVSRVLHHLIRDDGVAPSDIAVLMGSTRSGPLKRGERIGAFDTTGDQTAEPSKVLLESIRRFKGLERPVVLLTAIDDLPVEEETAMLYVGLSRARVHLIVIATDATMRRLVPSHSA